ncbi:hypothetical protein EMCG_07085 [[Emmonsia] crescens]|uniref:Uncharacterized protein n=1 Tax=[Emmonsia] crescens TaxID=73230 RepID=A0A0G2J612_9EURO|nr:hypothetical protein EMCG_07085 [Emmonsia crescens UAMH 3008]
MLINKNDVNLFKELIKVRQKDLLSKPMFYDVEETMNDAIETGRVDMVRLFVKYGATVKAVQFYKTLSSCLASEDVLQLTQIFITASSFKENCPDAIGMAIVILQGFYNLSSTRKYLAIMLLHAGFDKNHQDTALYRTPLHCAADGKYTEIFHLLLRAGADVSLRDKYDRTAFDAVNGVCMYTGDTV